MPPLNPPRKKPDIIYMYRYMCTVQSTCVCCTCIRTCTYMYIHVYRCMQAECVFLYLRVHVVACHCDCGQCVGAVELRPEWRWLCSVRTRHRNALQSQNQTSVS